MKSLKPGSKPRGLYLFDTYTNNQLVDHRIALNVLITFAENENHLHCLNLELQKFEIS